MMGRIVDVIHDLARFMWERGTQAKTVELHPSMARELDAELEFDTIRVTPHSDPERWLYEMATPYGDLLIERRLDVAPGCIYVKPESKGKAYITGEWLFGKANPVEGA